MAKSLAGQCEEALARFLKEQKGRPALRHSDPAFRIMDDGLKAVYYLIPPGDLEAVWRVAACQGALRHIVAPDKVERIYEIRLRPGTSKGLETWLRDVQKILEYNH